MRCSIVIPTINRAHAVMQVCDDLSRQTFNDTEIIVIDQSPVPDDTLRNRAGIVYRHVDAASTPHARNVGADTATGDIVLYFDDDVRIHDEKLVERIMVFFADHQAYQGVACTIEDKNQKLNKENTKEHKRVMTVTKTGRVLPYAFGPEQDVVAPRGGAMAFRKKAIKKVGGFDERYVGNAMREETDFSLRVVKRVGPIRYLPELSIVHLALPSGGSRTHNRMQWYRDFFANELLFQMTHFSTWYMKFFFARKLRPILSCIIWYGKLRPSGFRSVFGGFRDGLRRHKKGFIPYAFSSES